MKIQHKIKLIDLLEWILALLLLLNCNSVYSKLYGSYLFIDEMILILSAFLALYYMRDKCKMNHSFIGIISLIFIISSIYIVVKIKDSNVKMFLMHFLIALPCFLVILSASDDKLSIYHKFSDIVFYLSTISTIIWVFMEIIPVLNPNMSVDIIWGNTHRVEGFCGLSFRIQRDTTFGFRTFYRNSGIFTEGPMFSLVICLALAYETLFATKLSKKRIVFLILYNLTILSTTGILCIGLCIGLLVWRRIQEKNIKIRIIFSILFSFGFLAAVLAAQYLIEIKSSTGSFAMRMDDYICGYRAFMANPLFGVGYANITLLSKYRHNLTTQLYYITHNQIGFSNSISAILGQGGILLSALYLFPFILCFFEKNVTHEFKLWTIVFLTLIISTIFHTRFIMFYFLALAYAEVFQIKITSARQIEHLPLV